MSYSFCKGHGPSKTCGVGEIAVFEGTEASLGGGIMQIRAKNETDGIHCRVFRPALPLGLFLIAITTSAASIWQLRSQQERPPRVAQHSPAKRPVTRKPHKLQISKVNDPNTADPIGPSSEGEAVIRASILLDRVKFSRGEISQSYTDNFSKAVSAYQLTNGLPATGNVDPATWTKLNQAQGTNGPTQDNSEAGTPQQNPNPSGPQAIISYVILLEDVHGPFTKLPRVRGPNAGEQFLLQEAKLHELNYESPLELLAEKFHSSPKLLVELNPGKAFDKAGVQIDVPNVLTPDPPQAASVVVDASTKSVTPLDITGKMLAFYPATVGSEHDPLPAGNWKITEVTRYPHFKYNPNLFWDSENKHPRATLPPGPKNPVGVVWIGLSKEHYGIHGTPEPSTIGVTQSHGCIRLTNWDALELSKIVHVGTPAVLKAS